MTTTGPSLPSDDDPPFGRRLRRLLFGRSLDPADPSLAHKLSLIAVLAWIGLGADALSSSCYGPEASFKTIGDHTHLAIPLALATALTVFLISAAYSKVVEVFPNGGGYGVASRLLGQRVGVVSGCALLVDYVLTITTSIASMGDALFSTLPPSWKDGKLYCEILTILVLTGLNLRGVRESILVLAPIFLVFVISHIILIGGGLALQAPQVLETTRTLHSAFQADMASTAVGLGGLVAILLNAYAMGGGTYTGLEAVSNALPLMREPRVSTAKRTMLYMSVSLAVTAGGLILCYLLWQVKPDPDGNKTMNALLAEGFAAHLPGGSGFVIVALVSEALLLVVAAQAGFVGGPRVMANLAVDSWLPRRFATLSDRLTTENGVLFMGGSALIALWSTHGSMDALLVMYSINVFLTFTLTMVGMFRFWWSKTDADTRLRRRRLVLFAGGSLLCGAILAITVKEKFDAGGWITIVATGLLVWMCMLIRNHYRFVNKRLTDLYRSLETPHGPAPAEPLPPPDPAQPVAVVLVSSYGGPGIHTTLNVFKAFPHHFRGLVFLSVGVVDSGDNKGEDAVEVLRHRTEESLRRYVELAHSLKVPATSRMAIGTDPVEESVALCRAAKRDFPKATFFAGKVIFARERWFHWLLHNDTAFAVQRRLQWDGITTVVLPARCP